MSDDDGDFFGKGDDAGAPLDFPSAPPAKSRKRERPGSVVRDDDAASKHAKPKGGAFGKFGLSAAVLQGVLRLGYKVPTPIQRVVLPVALSGRDVLAMARTGSG